MKAASRQLHRRKIIGFDEAVRIGYLYDATDERDYETVKSYIRNLRSQFKKDVSALGFVDKKSLPPSQFAQFGIDFFTRKDLDYRLIPSHPVVQNFIREPFDVLVNLAQGDCFPLRYISVVSHATFRVGRYDHRNLQSYDMMIHIEGNPDIKTVLEQSEIFLKQIKLQTNES
ncbi:MAG: hypothetical protein IT242_08475 [Bacteroidia bacterium]|nr:hypothetical protein [Bacteroidia bacterium]